MYVYLAIALLSAALSGVGVWRVQDWRYGAQEAARMAAAKEQQRELARKSDTAAVGHEKDKRDMRTEFIVITEKVNATLQTEFYAAGAPACLDDAGVREYNAAATGPAPAASEPARAVRGLNPAGWWKPSRSAEKAD